MPQWKLSAQLFKVFSFLRSALLPAEGTLESEVVIKPKLTTINTRIKLTATIRTWPLCQIDFFTPSLWGSVVHYCTKLLWVDIKLFYKLNKNSKAKACTMSSIYPLCLLFFASISKHKSCVKVKGWQRYDTAGRRWNKHRQHLNK